ncbi:MAG: molybdopterin-binding protein [Elusimicrobia bacterium]|nr:molybdopterin-binding protein [Elusimicrobiota bacterium]
MAKQSGAGKVVSLNVSEGKGTPKSPRQRVELGASGIKGDAHAGPWHRQVSLLAIEDVERFSKSAPGRRRFRPGEFAENITTRGVDLGQVGLLDRLSVGPAELEISQIGKACHGEGCAVFKDVGRCVMPKAGLFARVLRGGVVRPGDPIVWRPRALRIGILTLSDRASAGIYEDRSGSKIQELLEDFFKGKRWHPRFQRAVIPDEQKDLLARLRGLCRAGCDVIMTTGGTGIGPRDITPETVAGFADRLIPGIMEQVRLKHADRLPAAVLSRSLAAVKGRTLIYCLPGSPKAAAEYVAEIVKSLEHALAMLHGLGH